MLSHFIVKSRGDFVSIAKIRGRNIATIATLGAFICPVTKRLFIPQNVVSIQNRIHSLRHLYAFG